MPVKYCSIYKDYQLNSNFLNKICSFNFPFKNRPNKRFTKNSAIQRVF